MRFRVTMKTPDALDEAIVDAIGEDEEKGDIARQFAQKYFRYGEYLTVEFDTEAKTATVIPA